MSKSPPCAYDVPDYLRMALSIPGRLKAAVGLNDPSKCLYHALRSTNLDNSFARYLIHERFEVMTHYEIFHQLHHRSTPLLLANVWNVKSARIVEASGFEAMGTSSGAIAESLGYKDGEQISFGELFYVVERIRSCTDIPLTVDLERGYTDDPDILNAYVQKLVDAGVAGINLEDQQGEDLYLRKLNSISGYLTETGQQLFINARTDVFSQKLPDPIETILKRAKRYLDAGAQGLFVTGVSDPEVIRQIVAGTSLPVNVVGVPALASVADLAACGVSRISMAAQLYKATYRNTEMIASEILSNQSLAPLFQNKTVINFH